MKYCSNNKLINIGEHIEGCYPKVCEECAKVNPKDYVRMTYSKPKECDKEKWVRETFLTNRLGKFVPSEQDIWLNEEDKQKHNHYWSQR